MYGVGWRQVTLLDLFFRLQVSCTDGSAGSRGQRVSRLICSAQYRLWHKPGQNRKRIKHHRRLINIDSVGKRIKWSTMSTESTVCDFAHLCPMDILGLSLWRGASRRGMTWTRSRSQMASSRRESFFPCCCMVKFGVAV